MRASVCMIVCQLLTNKVSHRNLFARYVSNGMPEKIEFLGSHLSLKVIECDMNRSNTCELLLVIRSNHGPTCISNRFEVNGNFRRTTTSPGKWILVTALDHVTCVWLWFCFLPPNFALIAKYNQHDFQHGVSSCEHFRNKKARLDTKCHWNRTIVGWNKGINHCRNDGSPPS